MTSRKRIWLKSCSSNEIGRRLPLHCNPNLCNGINYDYDLFTPNRWTHSPLEAQKIPSSIIVNQFPNVIQIGVKDKLWENLKETKGTLSSSFLSNEEERGGAEYLDFFPRSYVIKKSITSIAEKRAFIAVCYFVDTNQHHSLSGFWKNSRWDECRCNTSASNRWKIQFQSIYLTKATPSITTSNRWPRKHMDI